MIKKLKCYISNNAIVNIIYRKFGRTPRKGVIDKSVLINFLPKNPIIIEAGAHLGYDTIELAKIFPKGHIFAFEPVTDIFSQLVENTKLYPNITCQQFALGSNNGSCTIFISDGESDASSSLLLPKEHLDFHPNVTFNNTEIVALTTIDSWVSKMGLNHIDFLWLDLQGMELSVLRASPKVLENVKAIYTEVCFRPFYENAGLYPDLKKFLRNAGFKVSKAFHVWRDEGNVLFIKK